MSEQLELRLPPPHPPLPSLPDLWTPDDIYSALDAVTLARFREDRRLERKSARIEPRALGEYFSMWANTSPDGGIIVIGMEKDGRLTGCRMLSHSQKNAIELTGQHFCPDSRSEPKRIPIINASGSDDFVIAIRVFYRPDRLVETTSAEAFIRIGDEKHRILGDEKRELRIAKGEIEYEKELVSLSYPLEFDDALISRFCDDYRSSVISQESTQLRTYCASTISARMLTVAFDQTLPAYCCSLLTREPWFQALDSVSCASRDTVKALASSSHR